MEYKSSEKYIEALNTLNNELKPIFDDFVSDYMYAATLGMGNLIYLTLSWPIWSVPAGVVLQNPKNNESLLVEQQ